MDQEPREAFIACRTTFAIIADGTNSNRSLFFILKIEPRGYANRHRWVKQDHAKTGELVFTRQ